MTRQRRRSSDPLKGARVPGSRLLGGGSGQECGDPPVRARGGSRSAAALLLGLFLFFPHPVASQLRLTLEAAVTQAQERSSALQIRVHQVEELEFRSSGMRANYFPQLGTQVTLRSLHSNRELPPGLEGGLFLSFTTLSQPVTQLLRVRHGFEASRAEVDASRARLHAARNEVALGTIQLFGGLLVARLERDAAEARTIAAEVRTATRSAAAGTGSALEVEILEARVEALEARRRMVGAENRIEGVSQELNDLLGYPPGTSLELVPPGPIDTILLLLDDYVEAALRLNPEVLEARATLRVAEHGVSAARAESLPDLGIGVTHLYQSSFDFLPRNSLGLGLQFSWTPMDGGRRRSVAGERRAQLDQARAQLDLVEARVRREVEDAWRSLRYATLLVELAREAQQLRQEVSRLQESQRAAGLGLAADARLAEAETASGRVDLLQAEIAHRLALAELHRATGELVRR